MLTGVPCLLFTVHRSRPYILCAVFREQRLLGILDKFCSHRSGGLAQCAYGLSASSFPVPSWSLPATPTVPSRHVAISRSCLPPSQPRRQWRPPESSTWPSRTLG